ncbi:MAG: 3-dehydroquinate synthase [Lachnospiraceae bacterium]|nr:3-dehydroquinate synthase [Lachnospiraceae bacterium]
MSKDIMVHYEGNPAYSILIEQDYNKLSGELKKIGYENRRICIVCDSHVSPLYSELVKKELLKVSGQVSIFTFPAGEEHKNLDTVKELYTFLIEHKFDRKDLLAALGGGVTGDLTGYVAATYLRGIDFIQLPTSVLAMVDSSIGGKTGVDFDSYKNMVGAFHQPKLVYMNLSVLDTLDLKQYYAGYGEILKHGLIRDLDYYVWLLQHMAEVYTHEPEVLEEVIYQSCLIKRDVVENDPKEKGERALLNFGHTLGHAIEKLKNFELLHGECVALGMVAASYISWKRGYIEKEEFLEIRDMMVAFRLPISLEGLEASAIVAATKLDKKMDGNNIKFILLKEVGCAEIDTTVTDEEMLEALDYLMQELPD